MQFSNPRLASLHEDWPIGGSHRGKCEFRVEEGSRGVRVSRRTTAKNGEWCKPKFTTYCRRAAIVDGDDGKTYILMLSNQYLSINIKSSDLSLDAPVLIDRVFNHPTAYVVADGNGIALFTELRRLIDEAK